MDIRSYIRKTIGKLLAVIAWTPILYACDGLIYDGEGDCSVNYRVKFCYDYNMKFADAFAHEVNVVTLYLLDADGRVVWQRTEQGEALAADGYAMTVDVEPGEIREDSRFVEDLGFNSYDFMSMVGEIEEHWDVEVDEREVVNVKTVKDAMEYIQSL